MVVVVVTRLDQLYSQTQTPPLLILSEVFLSNKGSQTYTNLFKNPITTHCNLLCYTLQALLTWQVDISIKTHHKFKSVVMMLFLDEVSYVWDPFINPCSLITQTLSGKAPLQYPCIHSVVSLCMSRYFGFVLHWKRGTFESDSLFLFSENNQKKKVNDYMMRWANHKRKKLKPSQAKKKAKKKKEERKKTYSPLQMTN